MCEHTKIKSTICGKVKFHRIDVIAYPVHSYNKQLYIYVRVKLWRIGVWRVIYNLRLKQPFNGGAHNIIIITTFTDIIDKSLWSQF